jgi:aspartyl-tRNA synthetase
MAFNQYSLKEISEECLDKEIYTYGRVHKIRALGKRCFVILRDQIWSIQCIMNRGDNEDARIQFKNVCKIIPESFVRIRGTISTLPENVPKVKYTYYQNFEMKIVDIEVISKSTSELPLTLEDVNELYGNKDRSKVLLHTRLDNRAFDLRVPFNNCIFKIQSAVCKLFRDYLLERDFMEIHSPKIIGTESEGGGGAAVFKVNYFGSSVYLAQSPQLYKQMCINSDFNRVFEIGPVFRAENSISHRHLCEFTGLDMELALTPGRDYYEIIDTFWGMLSYIFDNIKIICSEQISYIKSIYSYEDLVYTKTPLIIDFKEAVKMLRDIGQEQDELGDLNSHNEKKLGELVKQKYGSDLFVLDKYPANVRPFYTMPANDPRYSNSYDVILRGQEISSGSQRVHDLQTLLDRLAELKLNPSNFSDYLTSFSYGSIPHGGAGFGLERIVMLYLKLDNVRETSLYPRDPHRVTP